MADFIPFVNTGGDCDILKNYYDQSEIIRVSLERIDSIKSQLPSKIALWIDPAVDGYEHHLKDPDNDLPTYLKQCDEYQILSSSTVIRQPDKKKVEKFVTSVLNQCIGYKPKWISIPQLPVPADPKATTRNRINSLLAEAAKRWKVSSGFSGKLILPLVFTHQEQLNQKSKWRPILVAAITRYKNSGAEGIWVVDASLSDQLGIGNFRNRFSALVDLHEYLDEGLPTAKIIAGPYWGMNLILWARGLADHPAISLGTAYQYRLSGTPPTHRRTGKSRIVIAPLKRWVAVTPEFDDWLRRSLGALASKDNAFKNLKTVQQELGRLQSKHDFMDQETNRLQIALFYKDWLTRLEETPKAGRQLALYQDFSSAYVLGKHLPILPPSGNSARRPEKVAEYFMLNCL